MRYWKFRPHLFFLTSKIYCFESFNYTANKTYIKNTFSGIVYNEAAKGTKKNIIVKIHKKCYNTNIIYRIFRI